MLVTTLLRSAAMSNGWNAGTTPRNAVEGWCALTATDRQQWLGQGVNLGLAKKLPDEVARCASATTYCREFKRHETEPID